MKVTLFLFALLVLVAVSSSRSVQRCGRNEVHSNCLSNCPPTCKYTKPRPCIQSCKVGCGCKPGFLRNSHGVCVTRRQCS